MYGDVHVKLVLIMNVEQGVFACTVMLLRFACEKPLRFCHV